MGMKLRERFNLIINCLVFLMMALAINNCESKYLDPQNPDGSDNLGDYPPFITPTIEYFDVSIAGKPAIDGDSFQLKISGAVNNPAEFSLEELRSLEMVEKTVTIECIGNPANGDLLGTATWKGFSVYDLLENLGIKDGATFVKYTCADGYFTFNTLEELKNREVTGALFMNDEPIPTKYGFPLRIIFPGYYGVRQPGWVVKIELLGSGIRDYWNQSQMEIWNTDSSMAIDSKIFFPENNDTLTLGDNLRIGGAAYGGKRISSVEITVNDGETWIPAIKKQSLEQDYVWIFWEVNFVPQSVGAITIRARATAQDGRVQPRADSKYLDGINSWPWVTIYVKDGS